ncbi:hypothetical protein K1719_034461 [Acacia pycnantha]|nr:hypothetical protein K1719_034461 [Acacia pycnantha]
MSEKRAKRASVRQRPAGSGRREGMGDGDGEEDGGSEKDKGGSGFAFGQPAEGKQSGKEIPKGFTANLKNGTTPLSYRDKLLSLGCAGFLVNHTEDDDIVQGWKTYFNSMNEKDVNGTIEESDEEDNCATSRLEGRSGVLNFTAEEYTTWCLPWMNSLIIKVMGARFPTYIIRDRINRMWRPKDPLKLIPLSNDYCIVSFSNKEDRDYAFQKGPWMIEDHYLIVQRWRLNFNPWKADLQCRIALGSATGCTF